ncbi:MAG: AmiS/UreI family transporter [Firmicutes bacterium]|nr:AmiS/UreI family transporter [Bacillota bacterium]
MLGIALLVVGIVLVHNGILFMSNTKTVTVGADGKETEKIVPLVVASPKSIAYFNLIVGALLVAGNLIMLAFHAPMDLRAEGGLPSYVIFQNIAAGLVFGITYLFIAGNLMLKLDGRSFGIFSIGASIFAVVMVIYNIAQVDWNGPVSDGNTFMALAFLWLTWFVLWFSAVLQFTFKMKVMEKIFPYISIAVGVIGAFVPAILLLTGVWGLL